MKNLIALFLFLNPLVIWAESWVVSAVDGTVLCFRNYKKLELKEGDKLEYADKIKVEADAVCEIQLGDKNSVSLSEGTIFTIKKDESNKVGFLGELSEGTVRCKLDDLKNRTFTIKTPSAVAGVRGTDFVASYNPKSKSSENAFDLSVLEGEVELRPIDKLKKVLKAQRIKAGFQIGVQRSGKFKKAAQMMKDRVKSLQDKFPVGARMKDMIKNRIKMRLQQKFKKPKFKRKP